MPSRPPAATTGVIGPAVDVLEALGRAPLFATLDRHHLGLVLRRASQRSYATGHVLMTQGEPGDSMEVLLSGEVQVTMTSPQGRDLVLALLGPGEPIGELALLDGGARSATVTATEPTEALVIYQEEFHDILRQSPDIALALLKVMTERVRATDHLVADSRFLDVPARVAKKLLELANTRGVEAGRGIEIDLQLTQTTLAALIGASRESVSKALTTLRRAGVVTAERHRITILDRDTLSASVQPR